MKNSEQIRAHLEALNEIFRNVCENDNINLDAQTKIVDVPGMDSFRILAVVLEIEKVFDVDFDVEKLFKTGDLSYILDLISSRHQ